MAVVVLEGKGRVTVWGEPDVPLSGDAVFALTVNAVSVRVIAVKSYPSRFRSAAIQLGARVQIDPHRLPTLGYPTEVRLRPVMKFMRGYITEGPSDYSTLQPQDEM